MRPNASSSQSNEIGARLNTLSHSATKRLTSSSPLELSVWTKWHQGVKRTITMPKVPTTPGTCFVIMPFRKPFDGYYRDVIAPAIETAGLTAVRADEINKPGVILNQIWKGITEAQICLADLTGRNANVMYEVGLA